MVLLVIVVVLAIAATALTPSLRVRRRLHEGRLPSAPPASDHTPAPEVDGTHSRAPRTPRARLDLPEEHIEDLRPLGGMRLRVVGTAYLVPHSRRQDVGGYSYVLVREPSNRHDANAVAVYDATRKVGYLSRAKAAVYAPHLDRIGAPGYRVAGEPPAGSVKLWIVLPPIAKVRAFPSTEREKPSTDG